MAETIKCKGCGEKISSIAKFCSNCGEPIQGEPQKKSLRFVYLLLVVIALIIANYVSWSHSPIFEKKEPTILTPEDKAAIEASQSKEQAKKQVPGQVSLEYFKIATDGFTLNGFFVVINHSQFTIKDIKIICTYYGPSGTEIDSSTKTIYDTVGPDSGNTFSHINMGLIRDQVDVKKSYCEVSDFKIN